MNKTKSFFFVNYDLLFKRVNYVICGRLVSLFFAYLIPRGETNDLYLSVLGLRSALTRFCILPRAFTVTAIAQTCILGLMWVFGAFLFQKDAIVVAYIFTILNSLQGALVFVMHCLLSKQVRKRALLDLFEGRGQQLHRFDRCACFFWCVLLG